MEVHNIMNYYDLVSKRLSSAVSPGLTHIPDVHHGPGQGVAVPVQHPAPEDDGHGRVLELSVRSQAVFGAHIADKVRTLRGGLSQIPALGATSEPEKASSKKKENNCHGKEAQNLTERGCTGTARKYLKSLVIVSS